MPLVKIGLAALYVLLEEMDARDTVKSYPAGGAEGNELITTIFKTNKPTLKQLRLFNLVEYAVLAGPLVLLSYVLPSETARALTGGFGMAVQAAMPFDSYLGVREWLKWEKK